MSSFTRICARETPARYNAYSHGGARGDHRSIGRLFDPKLIETFDACVLMRAANRQLLEQYTLQWYYSSQVYIYLLGLGIISCDGYDLLYNMRLHLYSIVFENITAFLPLTGTTSITPLYRHCKFVIIMGRYMLDFVVHWFFYFFFFIYSSTSR